MESMVIPNFGDGYQVRPMADWWLVMIGESHTLAQNIWSIELMSPTTKGQQWTQISPTQPEHAESRAFIKSCTFWSGNNRESLNHPLDQLHCGAAAFPLPLALPFASPFPASPQISCRCEVLLGMSSSLHLGLPTDDHLYNRGVSNIKKYRLRVFIQIIHFYVLLCTFGCSCTAWHPTNI